MASERIDLKRRLRNGSETIEAAAHVWGVSDQLDSCARAQKSAGMQSLQPLGIIDVTFTTGNRLGFKCIDEDNVQPFGLQYFEDGYPVDTRRFHCNGLNANGNEPIGHPHKITGEGLKRLHRLITELRTDRDHMEAETNINAGRTLVNHGCWRRPKIDPPCRSKFDPGRGAAFLISNCG